jgi:hypothetical protein
VIPLGLKVVYTIFVCALPIFWREYGSANFLWFSDIALLALVPALWLENAQRCQPLLTSNMMAQKYFKRQGSGSQQTWDQGFENGYTDGFNKAHLRK